MRRKKRMPVKNSRKKRRLKAYGLVCLVLIGAAVTYYAIDTLLGPVLYEVAEIRVKEVVSKAINDSLIELMDEMGEYDEQKFVNYEVDENGYISMVSANTTYMNWFSSEITKRIHDNLTEIEGEQVKITVGAITGSNLLSQVGPSVDLKIQPIGNAAVNFNTEFISEGINQTKYKVYMEVQGKAKPIIPFVSEVVEISTSVPVAEAVIVGQVPSTYLEVPLKGN